MRFREKSVYCLCVGYRKLTCLALVCLNLTGCAVLTYVVLGGTSGWLPSAVMVGLSPVAAIPRAVEAKHCDAAAVRGLTVTDVEGVAAPIEGIGAQVFQLTTWRPALETDGVLERDTSASLDGALAITKTSVDFVPTTEKGFRIPYETMLGVAIQDTPVKLLVIKSCGGRFDAFIFWLERRKALDSGAPQVAAAQIKTHLAEFRQSPERENE